MKLEYIFPKEIEEAKRNRTPLVIPVGTIEYHGPHCSFGCDTLVALGLLERLEKEMDIIVVPRMVQPRYAVAGPEKGTVHVEASVLKNTSNDIKIPCRRMAKHLYVNTSPVRTGKPSAHDVVLYESGKNLDL